MGEPLATQTITQITPEIHKVPPISGFVTIFGVTINPMVIALCALAACLAYMTYCGIRSNHFNPWDLVQDVRQDGVRIASLIKTTFSSAFLVSSWVVVFEEIKGTLTEGMFMAYLSVWCASLIAKVVFEKADPPKIAGIDK